MVCPVSVICLTASVEYFSMARLLVWALVAQAKKTNIDIVIKNLIIVEVVFTDVSD